jgi:hypothetical protein
MGSRAVQNGTNFGISVVVPSNFQEVFNVIIVEVGIAVLFRDSDECESRALARGETASLRMPSWRCRGRYLQYAKLWYPKSLAMLRLVQRKQTIPDNRKAKRSLKGTP